MQYKKHPIDRALEAFSPIVAPSFTLRSSRDSEREVRKYPLIDYTIVGAQSKEYNSEKNEWRSHYLVILEILVEERKPLSWCQYPELATAQDRHSLFYMLEQIIEQLLVLLTNPSKISNLIRPLDTVFSDLFFKLENFIGVQNKFKSGGDETTGVVANFVLSCVDEEGSACCLIDYNNIAQLHKLRDLMQFGSVSWNLLNQASGGQPITACDKLKEQVNKSLLINCLLELYDFSDAETQTALSDQQETDLTAYLLPIADCQELLDYLTTTQKNDCLLQNYDFSALAVQTALSPSQISDIEAFIIPSASCNTLILLLTDLQKNECLLLEYDFSNPAIQALLTAQQLTDLTSYIVPIASCPQLTTLLTTLQLNSCVLPLYNFADVSVQNSLTVTQAQDLKEFIVPSLDFEAGFDDDFNLLVQDQIDDLTLRLCGSVDLPSSMVFDGVNENVFALNKASYDFDGTTAFSFSIWVKFNNLTGIRALLSKRINLGAGFSIGTSGTSLILNLVNTDATNHVQCSFLTAFVTNTWYRVTVTYNGTKQATGTNCYVNGVIKTKTIFIDNLTGNINSGTLVAIGRNSSSGSIYLSGKSADVTIWDTELSASDAILDYNAGQLNATPILPINFVFNWQGGKGAYYGGNGVWVFKEQSGLSEQGLPYSFLMEYADRDTLDYPQ